MLAIGMRVKLRPILGLDKRLDYTVIVVEVGLKLIFQGSYFILCSTISVFVITQYNLMVGAYFSLIGYDPKVSHLLASIAISIADVMKGL